MGFFEISEQLLNKTFTENGDVAFASSGSACLDYFAQIGGKRDDLKNAALLFVRALAEDPKTAVQLLFYTRDPRDGIGERRLFRFLFSSLASSYPDAAAPLLPFFAKYGRYDDLFCVFGTPLEDDAITLIEEQLEADLAAKKEGKPTSLLAKWLPSINTSSYEARRYALHLAQKLGLSKADYRKTLSFLRKGMIVENDLREKNYGFDYAEVPSLAMQKYHDAFSRNDEKRFSKYLSSVAKGESKMNVGVANPVALLTDMKGHMAEKDFDPTFYETAWEVYVEEGKVHKKTLVVRDGSGSMVWNQGSYTPLDVADAMALLTAARLQGAFHNRFLTFSSHPELVDLTDQDTLKGKLLKLSGYHDCTNTDIEKVYNLILDVYQSPDFKPEDALDQILVISDMEFDMAMENPEQSTFDLFDEKFAKLKCPRPEVVFWNVASRGRHVPVTKDKRGVKLVSGSSKNVIEMVSMTDSLDPLDFMKRVLSRYQDVANALPKEE
ncbi:MAG: DUF2828 family protein [Bacilli bacterium]|nr:DUF2828 family protein [Bacilli bacterium]